MKDTKTSHGMLKEAGSINKSLFALGKVCTQSHVQQLAIESSLKFP